MNSSDNEGRELPRFSTDRDRQYKEEMNAHLESLVQQRAPLGDLVNCFAKYGSRQKITQFLARYELYKMVQDIQGCVIECGVFAGQGLMSWAQFSAIMEPVGGAFRHIYGFDTFGGFPSVHEKDVTSATSLDWRPGDIASNSYDDLQRSIELFDLNRFLPQFPKVSLIKGDFMETADKFIEDNPHVLVSLLYLDFDLYEPTKKALEVFLPRAGRGSVIAFDEINMPLWPGETLAMLEEFNVRDVMIQKFQFEFNISYIVL